MEPKISIDFTATQLQNVGALLDMAVKAGGMQAAKAALPIQETLEKAVADFNSAQGAPAPVEATEEGHA